MAENEVLKVGFGTAKHNRSLTHRLPPPRASQELYRELRDSSRDKGDCTRVKREYLALREDYKLARTLAAEMERPRRCWKSGEVMLEKEEVAGRVRPGTGRPAACSERERKREAARQLRERRARRHLAL